MTQNKIFYIKPKINKVYDVNKKFIESSINFNMTIIENYLLSQTQFQYFLKNIYIF